MPFELRVGLRYLRARRREKFISLISAFSTVGVILGVTTLILVLAVMTGFEDDLRKRILGFTPHIIVQGKDLQPVPDPARALEVIRRTAGVVAAAAVATGQVMLSSQGNVTGTQIRGIGVDAAAVLDLGQYLKEGRLDDLGEMHDVPLDDGRGPTVKMPGIVLGKDISRHLGLLVGDPVSVISPLSTPTAIGLVPRVKRFVVTGIFESSMEEYDSALAYIDIQQAQKFFDLDAQVSQIEIRVPSMDDARGVADDLRVALGIGFEARDWMQSNRSLFAALKLEKLVYTGVLLLIVLVAAFNIVAMLIMVVMEKRKDIAVLKSMGTTSASVSWIFRYNGMIIGVIGTVIGNILGGLGCLLLRRFEFVPLPPDVFFVNTLPVSPQLAHFVGVSAAALAMCAIATIYPAREAARLTPVDVIRND